jgi:hypothetical protein
MWVVASPEDEAWGRAAATVLRAEIDQNEPQFITEGFLGNCKLWNRLEFQVVTLDSASALLSRREDTFFAIFPGLFQAHFLFEAF